MPHLFFQTAKPLHLCMEAVKQEWHIPPINHAASPERRGVASHPTTKYKAQDPQKVLCKVYFYQKTLKTSRMVICLLFFFANQH